MEVVDLAVLVAVERGKLGINQKEMGSRLGLSLTAYNSLENGRILRPRMLTMLAISELTGIDLNELMHTRFKKGVQ